jgi:hypothetical protein
MPQFLQLVSPVVLVTVLAGACGGSDESRQASAETAAAESAATGAPPTETRVSNVMIGSQMGADGRISVPSFEFTPQDTVFVSVATEGPLEGARLTAAWRSPGGEILQQSAESVRPRGENTVFHLSEGKGLKPGTYKVVVFLANDSVDTKVFVVKK